jgi:hypothetical protein
MVNATPWSLYRGYDPVSIMQEAVWAPGPVWTGAEKLLSTEFDLRTVQPIVSRCTGWAYPYQSRN